LHILFYSPDSYGLGHVRRTISLAERVLGQFRDASALVLTGAPRAHYFRYPSRCDYVKLPSVTKGVDGCYKTREIDMPLDDTVHLRSRVIQETAASFHADVIVVDHSPLGLCGEVVPTLDSCAVGRTGTVRILGLRDVIDEPEAVRASWKRDQVMEVLRRCYDRILVYGQREVFDPVEAYGMPEDVAAKLEFVGYIGRNGVNTAPRDVRRKFAPRTGRLVVLTVGGGGDGNQLVRLFLEGCERLGDQLPFETVIVTGPLMSPRKRKRFEARAHRLEGVSALEYCDDLPGLCRAADFVVAMGGYNTVCELAYGGIPALIVPRTFPRKEQLERARRLAERGVVRFLVPEEATPETLMREVHLGMGLPRPPRRWGLDFSGLDRTARAIGRLVPSRSGPSMRPGRLRARRLQP